MGSGCVFVLSGWGVLCCGEVRRCGGGGIWAGHMQGVYVGHVWVSPASWGWGIVPGELKKSRWQAGGWVGGGRAWCV